MKYILETPRLRLREFTTEDTEFIIELLNTDGWLKFIGDRNVKTTQQAKEYLENGAIKSYFENGFGLWLVETKTDKNFKIPKNLIGMCGLIKREHLENPDIGFAFLPEYEGKGFGYEIANEVISYARNFLKLPVIYAITLETNISSRKLLGKIGMKFIKFFRFPYSNEELMLYGN
jgi:RimJ/RimL family protein N-acetyltransferase